ncbi:MAG: response regulator [Pseudomonadota bacterium]
MVLNALGTGNTTNRESLEQLIEVLPVGATLLNTLGHLVYVNQRFADFLGFDKFELLGRRPQDITHVDDLGATSVGIGRLQRREVANWSTEKRYIKKDGKVFWALTSVTPIELADGDIYLLSATEDINDRKRAETLIRALAQNAAAGNAGAFFDDLTRELATTIGVSHAFVTETIDHEHARVRTLAFWSDGRHVEQMEYSLSETPCERVALDGESVFFASSVQAAFPNDTDLIDLGAESYFGVPLFGRAGNPIGHLAILHRERLNDGNVPFDAIRVFASRAASELERSRAEDAAQRYAAQVQEQQKIETLGLFAGGIAHDFNNILMGILGNADLARSELPDGSPAAELIESVIAAARDAGELAHQLLDYAGKGHDPLEPVDLSDVVRGCQHLLRTANPQSAELRLDLARHLPAVDAAAGQIRQVLLNLLTNATQAIPTQMPGDITIRTDVLDLKPEDLIRFTTPAPLGQYVRLSVSDNGAGMDERTRERIFDPFYSTKPTGRGLGMGVVMGIVGRHHGALAVQSEPGRGTVVEVLFPVSDRPVQRSRNRPAGAPRDREMVLVVDDEDTVREVCHRYLSREGYDVVTARDGEEAIAIFKDFHRRGLPFASVMLDLAMPRVGGADAFRAITAIDANVPILIWTGFDQHDAVSELRAAGLRVVLRKPFTQGELIAALAEAMGTTEALSGPS